MSDQTAEPMTAEEIDVIEARVEKTYEGEEAVDWDGELLYQDVKALLAEVRRLQAEVDDMRRVGWMEGHEEAREEQSHGD